MHVDRGGSRRRWPPTRSRYLAWRPGRPLDPAEVRRTVELLHATGAYEDVIVEAADAPGGIALTLRLVAAPLLAAVVVEGDAVLSADEAREASRLRDQELLWTERLAEAARDVAVAATRRGYLEARVTAEARRERGERRRHRRLHRRRRPAGARHRGDGRDRRGRARHPALPVHRARRRRALRPRARARDRGADARDPLRARALARGGERARGIRSRGGHAAAALPRRARPRGVGPLRGRQRPRAGGEPRARGGAGRRGGDRRRGGRAATSSRPPSAPRACGGSR